jgi:hypothetical protein
MTSADLEGLVEDIFAEPSGDAHVKPHKPADRDAEAAKIARLRQLRLARHKQAAPKRPPRLIVTRSKSAALLSDPAMEFRCPYCLHTRFQMVRGRVDEAMCLWCGKESKITAPAFPEANQASLAGKPLPRSGRS